MSTDDVRSRIAHRISSEEAPLSTSALGRRARWVAGLAKAGAKSLGRSVRRAAGRDASDVDAEAAVVASLGQLKGPMMKLGQVLGYVDIGLPETLRSALSALHTNAQPLDAERIRQILDEDLGDPGRELARAMRPEALASASVGQVHRSVLPDGTAVVVKVLHPGLSTVIERDLSGAMFASRISSPVHAFVGAIRERLLEECDYALEAQRQARFAEIFAGHATILVPEVHHAYGSARVLTTTFIDGVHLDAFLASNPSQQPRNRVGEALFDFYIGTLFRHGLYNCDAHPGNFIFAGDGRVAIVDFGSVREFEPGFAEHLGSLTDAVLAADRDRMHDALVALGMDDGVTYDRDATWFLLHAFYGPLAQDDVLAFDLEAEVTLRQLLRSAWKARRVALSAELVFLLRTFVGLSSVLARLGARANWRRRLETVVAESAAAARVSRSSPERGFATSASARDSVTNAPTKKRVEVSWDVVLIDSGPNPIAVIRALRELMRKDLRDLEFLVDSVPETLKRALPRADAESLRKRLETLGARIEVRRA